MKNKLFITTLISYLGIYITMPILSAISTQAHFLPGQIGLMISLGALAMLIFAPIWGKLSDKIGRKPVIILGLLGMGIFFILYVCLFQMSISTTKAVSFLVIALMFTRFLLGIFMTTAPTAASAYMADISSPNDRPKDMASLGIATGLAMVLGPIIGGILSSFGSLYLPFYVTIVMLLIFAVIMLKALPKESKSEIDPNNDIDRDLKKANKSHFFSMKLFGWLIAGASVMFVMVGLQILTSLYLHSQLGQSVSQSAKTSSLLFVILGISLMIIQMVQMKLLNWTAKKSMTISIPLIVIGLLIITLSGSLPLLIISYILIGFGAGLGISSLSAGASLTVSQKDQGAVAGAVAMTQGIAGIISPTIGSLLFQINTKIPFIFFAVFAIIAELFFLMATRKN